MKVLIALIRKGDSLTGECFLCCINIWLTSSFQQLQWRRLRLGCHGVLLSKWRIWSDRTHILVWISCLSLFPCVNWFTIHKLSLKLRQSASILCMLLRKLLGRSIIASFAGHSEWLKIPSVEIPANHLSNETKWRQN